MSVRKVELEPIEFAPPCYTQGIQPKVKGRGGEDIRRPDLPARRGSVFRAPSSIRKPSSIRFRVRATSIWMFCVPSSRINSGVEVVLTPPIVPYREKDPQDRHGRGQA